MKPAAKKEPEDLSGMVRCNHDAFLGCGKLVSADLVHYHPTLCDACTTALAQAHRSALADVPRLVLLLSEEKAMYTRARARGAMDAMLADMERMQDKRVAGLMAALEPVWTRQAAGQVGVVMRDYRRDWMQAVGIGREGK